MTTPTICIAISEIVGVWSIVPMHHHMASKIIHPFRVTTIEGLTMSPLSHQQFL